MDPLGIYISVPFCQAKCSFCNFASGVFADTLIPPYIARVCDEIREARSFAARLGLPLAPQADSIYFGGGTPSLLEPTMFTDIFSTLRNEFTIAPTAEITVECAPGQLSDPTLAAILAHGVNRLSFGVQSFVDSEGAAVGRLHTGRQCRDEFRRIASAGIPRIALDLICGLPGQTLDSWKFSVDQAIATGVEHISLYMLEVDEGSRLGREKLRGGPRYGAAALPPEDHVADWYAAACAWLEGAGIPQYEISNFSRPGAESRHNLKYWRRQPYLGFGLDAHSMLRDGPGAARWAATANMNEYTGLGARGFSRNVERITPHAAFEEALFTGLRLVAGVSLSALRHQFGTLADQIDFAGLPGLLDVTGDRVSLTLAGRMVSNEVFGRLLEAVPV